MKYIVMECHPGYAILLAGDGSFVKAANLHYEVGQLVEAPVLTDAKPSKHRTLVRTVRSVSALAACFLLLFGLGFYRDRLAVYSSILLSINPSVKIELNRRGDVVGLVGEDADGKRLLEGYACRGKERTVVAGELIGRAVDMGYLADGGRVEFSIDTPSERAYEEYDTQLSSLLSAAADKQRDTPRLGALLPPSVKAPASFSYEISNFRSGASHTGVWDDDDDDDDDDESDWDDEPDWDDKDDGDDEDDEDDEDDGNCENDKDGDDD